MDSIYYPFKDIHKEVYQFQKKEIHSFKIHMPKNGLYLWSSKMKKKWGFLRPSIHIQNI